ncbi:DEKNAAC103592 [Brettanomyces naardenensis]|uniref:DEKNAAC103592 n=1 Tax=Brettanomyces naardenensis TaxID=13370 RepID=A0A448YNQ4_BRENA|nr:DEKNAAC103592 [Brettanomyces naardenensis]
MPNGELSLPVYEDEDCNDYLEPSSRQVLRIAINLKMLIDKLIPTTISEKAIVAEDSIIINDHAINAVYLAAGGEGTGKRSSARKYQAALVFCLLKTAGWYGSLMQSELSNSGLYFARMVAAEKIASILIDRETDGKYLFLSMLCHRYSINLNDEDADPENALELAVDMHSTAIVASEGYQRCIKWLWRGWIVQSSHDPSEYVLFRGTSNDSFWYHFDPGRIKTPLYQNILEILFSVFYLIVFTVIVNQDTDARYLDAWEIVYYLFTIGFSLDEVLKFSHIGYNYIQFSNAFNDTMYAIVLGSLCVRITGIYAQTSDQNEALNVMAYRVLSLAAPFMWTRMLLFLDVYQFVGTMIIIIKKMMKESIIFFVMLTFILIGFLQAFLGLDQADGKRDLTKFVVQSLLRTVLSGPDFDSMNRFASPYGSILYYAFTFIIVLILLNILIALYSQAYSDVVENATDEYLAQYSSKILKYIRAPDEKIFCPPLNLVEIVFLDIPFSWWLQKKTYDSLCDKIMLVLYAPLLVFIGNYESSEARRILYNRQMQVADDANEIDTAWNLGDGFDENTDNDTRITESRRLQERAEQEDPSFLRNYQSWKKSLDSLSPPIQKSKDSCVPWEEYRIYDKIEILTKLVEQLVEESKQRQQPKLGVS